jgi:ribonuclease D
MIFMTDAIWIGRGEPLAPLAHTLAAHASIGLDTEFLRERTFFPKLCLLQLSGSDQVWCVDALRTEGLEALVSPLTAAAPRKVIHAARQDLEAFYLTVGRVITPVFDTQIAAGCIGLKPQIGYAELVKTLLGVTLAKGQTRTDWSKRPLSAEQLTYAADDVRYLNEVAERLAERLRALGRERWMLEDCMTLEDPKLYEPDLERAWRRLRNLNQLPPPARPRARALAVWRERTARERDLPRGWILDDSGLFKAAVANPDTRAALSAALSPARPLNDGLADGVLEALRGAPAHETADEKPLRDPRPTPEQRALADRLAGVVDARAGDLGVSAEILAPRGELKALAMGERDVPSLEGWRRAEIGERLLEALA